MSLLTRIVNAFLGLALGLVSIACLLGSVAMFVNDKVIAGDLVMVAIAIISATLSLWGCAKSLQLIVGKPQGSDFLSPRTIRIASYFYLAIPLAGIVFGDFSKHLITSIIQVIAYLAIFWGLRRFAKLREIKRGRD